jgi:hypothetical protein
MRCRGARVGRHSGSLANVRPCRSATTCTNPQTWQPGGVDGELAIALARLNRAFAPYPRRALLDGCPHCRPSTPVDEHDLFSLTIRLGNTVGSREDVKSLLPLLLERLVTSNELDPGIVLSKLAQEQWRTWPPTEQQAVEEYLDAVWRSLLAEFPSPVEAFVDATEFLDAAALTGDSIDLFLAAWNAIPGPAADQHLALLVNGHDFADRHRKVMTAWLCRREAIRDRLLTAFERDHNAAWADDLARAYDILCWRLLAEQPR